MSKPFQMFGQRPDIACRQRRSQLFAGFDIGISIGRSCNSGTCGKVLLARFDTLGPQVIGELSRRNRALVLVTARYGGKRIGIVLAKTTRDEFLVAFHARIEQLRFGRQQGEIAGVVAIEGQMIIDPSRFLELGQDDPVELSFEGLLVERGHVVRLHTAPQ